MEEKEANTLPEGEGKKKKRKVLWIVLGSVFGVLFVAGATIGGLLAYANSYRTPDGPSSIIPNGKGLYQASGHHIYDPEGNRFDIRGVNAGNLFLQEGWLSPLALEPKKNEDGSYVKDNDGNIQYPEFGQEDLLEGLKKNPNCGAANVDSWLDYYYNAWWAEKDFQNVANLGLNTIRLPFYWRNILNEDFSLKDETAAFKHIDAFLEGAKKYNLAVILDLHGVPGSQNGYEHSGYFGHGATFWDNEEYIAAAEDLWSYVATHYKTTRKDLAPTILAYDLLNEPGTRKASEKDAKTTEKCYPIMDRLYKAIRKTGDEHVISIEFIWLFPQTIDPSVYHWQNVLYQMHFYNFGRVDYGLYWSFIKFTRIGKTYEVPYLCGEFTFFDNEEEWQENLEALEDSMGFGWTMWNYKASVVGSWDTSWGLYVNKLNLNVSKEETKLNVSICTYEEFKAVCDKSKTDDKSTGVAYRSVQRFINEHPTNKGK